MIPPATTSLSFHAALAEAAWKTDCRQTGTSHGFLTVIINAGGDTVNVYGIPNFGSNPKK